MSLRAAWVRLSFLGVGLCGSLLITPPRSTFAAGFQAEYGSAPDGEDPGLPTPIVEAPVVLPGERVGIRWSPIGPEVEEFELILSLDGGRSLTLRISPALDRREPRFTWNVPLLAAGSARIRIRARIHDREVLGPESRPFRIEPGSTGPTRVATYWEPGWRVVDESPSGAGASLGQDSRASLVAAPSDSAAVPSPRPFPASPTIRSHRAAGASPFAAAAVSAPQPPFHARLRPLRE